MSRPARTSIIAAGVCLLVIQVVGLVVWWKLPSWAPNFVITHSPWPGPIFRVYVASDGSDSQRAEVALLRCLAQRGKSSQGLLPAWFARGGIEERKSVSGFIVYLMDGRAEYDLGSSVRIQAMRDLLHEDLVEVVAIAVGESQWDTGLMALKAVQQLRDQRLVEPVARRLDSSSGSLDNLELECFDALSVLANRQAVPAMLRFYARTGYRDDQALDACLPLSAWEEPLAALTSDQPHIRLWAVDRLAAGGSARKEMGAEPSAIGPAICRTLADPNAEVTMAAIEAAGELAVRSAVEPLSRLLRHERSDLRRLSARALGAIGDGSVVPALLPLLDDTDPDVRGATARSLGQLGDSRVVEGLLRAMQDPDPLVGIEALESLRSLRLDLSQQVRFKQLRHDLDGRLGLPGPHRRVVTDGGP